MRLFSNSWFRAAAKFVVAGALLGWMIRSGRLDLSRLAGTLTHWPQILAMLAIVYIQMIITAGRWNLLLGAQGFLLSLQEAFSLTMIGSLFNMVIPGAVGGDVIKGYYVCRRTTGKAPEALTTIVMDRVLGLLGLVSLAAIAAVMNFRLGSGSRSVAMLRLFAIAATLAGGFLLALAVAVGGRVALFEKWQTSRWLGSLLRAIRSLTEYRRKPGVLIHALAVSIVIQMLSCVVFYLAVQALGGPVISWGYYLLLVPLGLITTALPVAPAGVGVGQAAFFTLFKIIPGASGALGAAACTLFQLSLILVYLTGLYSYLTYKHAVPTEIPATANEELADVAQL
jgi:glycosyltransferase 2 family protein